MYDWDADGYKEDFLGTPGVYLPLEGKTVAFSKADTAPLANVGSFTPASGTTDAAGKACVTLSSTAKGLETIQGIVDWPGNPHNGPELLYALAAKTWKSGTVGAVSDVTVEVWMDGVKVADSENGVITSVTNPMYTLVLDEETDEYIPVLNSAHVEVHVLDAYRNDLADYEVVYLLENINEVLGGSQNATSTRIPFAYLVDKDIYDDFDGVWDLDSGKLNYDTNEARPDASEPAPASDPYAYIVGPGGTESFFFNQWLGSEKPTGTGQPGVQKWFTRTPGWPFGLYATDADLLWAAMTWPFFFVSVDDAFDGFDGVLDDGFNGYLPDAPEFFVGLATDGAKAWTLDGWAWITGEEDPDTGEFIYDSVPDVNLLTGSNIDIQLAEGPSGYAHYKSILRVMVYEPANGLVIEGTPIFSQQVHKVWAEPVPKTVVLDKPADYAIAGEETHTMTVTVLDQFGNPVPDQDIYMYNDLLEGTIAADGTAVALSGLAGTMDGTTLMGTTDANGNLAVEYEQAAGTWGVDRVTAYTEPYTGGTVTATNGGIASNASTIQWIMADTAVGAGGLVEAAAGTQKVLVFSGNTDWDGQTLKCYLNPGGVLFGELGGQLYDDAANLSFSSNTMTWAADQGFFVNAATSSNSDDIPNWIWDQAY